MMAAKRIMLACAAGMSAAMLVQKMQEVARAQHKDYDIFAKSIADIDTELTNQPAIDVLLLGPQVKYLEAEARKKAAEYNVPTVLIGMLDYGTVNANAILAQVENAL